MELQMYFTAFVANVKRITKLAEPVARLRGIFFVCIRVIFYIYAIYNMKKLSPKKWEFFSALVTVEFSLIFSFYLLTN